MMLKYGMSDSVYVLIDLLYNLKINTAGQTTWTQKQNLIRRFKGAERWPTQVGRRVTPTPP